MMDCRQEIRALFVGSEVDRDRKHTGARAENGERLGRAQQICDRLAFKGRMRRSRCGNRSTLVGNEKDPGLSGCACRKTVGERAFQCGAEPVRRKRAFDGVEPRCDHRSHQAQSCLRGLLGFRMARHQLAGAEKSEHDNEDDGQAGDDAAYDRIGGDDHIAQGCKG